ncbi:MAG: alpha/beta hydrolase [Streptomycetaceae bacterium]|nr:alpha/beta hydrolase [Streptomycetaceae bacterium]
MPSRTHALMQSWFIAARERGPVDLATERAEAAAYTEAYRPILGVADEPAPGLLPGSYVMTPEDVRDDVVILYIHGGGFRSGCAAMARPLAAHLSYGTRARVVLPEYRLAPEHRYPAGLDDCIDAYARTAASLSPSARIVVAGESAGANLAMAVLLRRATEGLPAPLAAVLYSGVFDLRKERFESGSWVDNDATDPVLVHELGLAMQADYLADHTADDPIVSPVTAELADMPPLFVQVSSAERLLDDSLRLVDRAARAGVHVEMEVWPHMPHAWQVASGFLPEATEASARTSSFINRVADGRIVDGAALLGGPASLEELA